MSSSTTRMWRPSPSTSTGLAAGSAMRLLSLLRALADHGEDPRAFLLGDKTGEDFPKARHSILTRFAESFCDPGALAGQKPGVEPPCRPR